MSSSNHSETRKRRSTKGKDKSLKAFKQNSIPNGIILLLLVGILCIFGLYMVYSASYVGITTYTGETTTPWHFLLLQMRGIAIGLVLGYMFYRIPRMNDRTRTIVVGSFFGLSIALLMAAYIFGKAVNGSTRWLQLPFINIQPSELLKISLVLVVAIVLTRIKKRVLPVFLISMIFPALVAIENLSSGLLMAAAIFVMFAVHGLRKIQVITLAGVVGIFGVLFLLIESYRRQRITNYLTMLIDPLQADYQTKESLYALANGGLFGRGITYSTQKFFYLPEHHTDFIFAIVGEELGFLGEIVLIGLFFLMIYLIYQIAVHADSPFKKYACLGFGTLFAVQIVLNLGVVSGLLPVTGVTLPFLSYGGSSIMSSLMMVGFILGCSELGKGKRKNGKKKQ